MNREAKSTHHDAFVHDHRPMRQNAEFRHIFQTFHARISIIHAHYSMKIDQIMFKMFTLHRNLILSHSMSARIYSARTP